VTTALVLDIEGTTSPTASVYGALFGYVRERLDEWVQRHGSGPGKQLLDDARRYAGRLDATDPEMARLLREWLDANVKCEPLKNIQGLISGEGFRDGRLHGEFFPDVAPALRRWRADGARVYCYSSGSERNQRDWFTYARTGRLDELIDGYFDLASAGSKRTAAAYRHISEVIGIGPADIVFLSDSPDELGAAATAGWSVLGVARAGEPTRPVPPHHWITSFDQVDAHSPVPSSTQDLPNDTVERSTP